MSFLISSTGFAVTLGIFALGAVGSLAAVGNDRAAKLIGTAAALLGSLGALAIGLGSLITKTPVALSIPSSLPLLSFNFGIDPLSAFFMSTIALIAVCTSIFAFGYVDHFMGRYSLGRLGFFFNVFIASMMLVVTAQNVITFLMVWEIMSLSSYFLVIYEYHEAQNIKAGTRYFIMMHVSFAFIMLALFLLYRATGVLDFASMGPALASLTAQAGASPFLLGAILLSTLIGFGIKSGIIPLHVWLPDAHPAAPSHVSALMSGVMIKTGIYMMVRIFFGIMPTPPLWFGVIVLSIALISSLLGVLFALAQHDIKRLLAYHSIENIGIILLGVGSSLVFLSLGLPTFAMLALIAGLFHTLNHAIFKALLFLSAGSVVSQTHTRDMEHYGGLIKRMPATAAAFLVGAMAISALPPFNGFVSEWLTFQSLFGGIAHASSVGLSAAFILALGGLALTSGLAAACFVKAFGVVFLARPRSEAPTHAHEMPRSSQAAMSILAVLTLIVSIYSTLIVRILEGVTSSFGAFAGTALSFGPSLRTIALEGGSNISMTALAIALMIALIVVAWIVGTIGRGRTITTCATWDCGTPLTPRMEITAFGFAHSIITVMRGIMRPTRQATVDYEDANIRYFPAQHSVHFSTNDFAETYLYRPLDRAFTLVSRTVGGIQNGSINAYVLYMFITLLALFVIISTKII
ncbi:MAG TPA: proton-conducting transporter membrane subunit [Candidatus Paceibacterota bacterium]